MLKIGWEKWLRKFWCPKIRTRVKKVEILGWTLSHIPSDKKIIDVKVIEYGELVANGRYSSNAISYSRWYVTQIYCNIEMIIWLRTSIQSDIAVSKLYSYQNYHHLSNISKRKNYYCGIHLSCCCIIMN